MLSTPAHIPSPPPGSIVVGAYLRALRTSRGIDAQLVAQSLQLQCPDVTQMEQAAAGTLVHSRVRDMLRLYGRGNRTEIEQIKRLLAEPRDPRFLRAFDHGPGMYDRLAAVESCASSLRTYALHLLPWPYRTQKYAAALRRAAANQDVPAWSPPAGLTAPRPGDVPQFTLLLDERVLRRRIGGARVMASQLDHLLRLMVDEQARIHVLPSASSPEPLESTLTEAVIHGHRLYVTGHPAGIDYRAGSGYARILRTWLNEAIRACGPMRNSYDRISQARDEFWAQAVNEPDGDGEPELAMTTTTPTIRP